MKAKKKAWAKGKDPERCAKIAASKVGKKRPPHVIEAMRIGRTGKPQSAETRKKMSISQQANRGPNKPSPKYHKLEAINNILVVLFKLIIKIYK